MRSETPHKSAVGPRRRDGHRPLLLIDVDGVISLYGFDRAAPPAGRYVLVDGILHYLSGTAGGHLRSLAAEFELVWCTGWEERANDVLPRELGLPTPLPYLSFDGAVKLPPAHWKLAAIDAYAGPARPLAWIDDAHDERCGAWAAARAGPTRLVTAQPHVGITADHVANLLGWTQRPGS